MDLNLYKMHKSNFETECLHAFGKTFTPKQLPNKFTNPFHYVPHPTALLAVEQLQAHLKNQNKWVHDFELGKMFGVLVVKTSENKLGFLTAFSGVLGNKTIQPGFVPPIYNRKADESFYTELEKEINHITKTIDLLKSDKKYIFLIQDLKNKTLEYHELVSNKKKELKESKVSRSAIRKKARLELNDLGFLKLNDTLNMESMNLDYAFKHVKKELKSNLSAIQSEVESLQNEIEQLQNLRKEKSAIMQNTLFEKYELLNSKGESKNLLGIFKSSKLEYPPAGAGDCAAPKLLQYAFENNLQPLAMAEFWWGSSPKKEIRKQGYFYPACKTKCEPILNHMMEGLDVMPNSIEVTPKRDIELIYEDDFIAIINKPTNLLSVPGKNIKDSVAQRMASKFPNATGPIIVHRLDRSTSGLMVIAKNLEAYHYLQKQFSKHTVNKTYVALLDGVLDLDSGIVDLPLRVDLDNRPSQLVCFEHGKKAVTNWKVIERSDNQTRVVFTPITGRTHQLRVHAAHLQGLNTPIVGDDIYGCPKDRLHLHAESIEFVHPITKKEMKFSVLADF